MVVNLCKRGISAISKDSRFRRSAKPVAAAWCLVTSLSLSVAAQNAETTRVPDPAFSLNEMRVRVQTKAREMTIGRQASRRFERRTRLVKDIAAQEYVNRIGKRLEESSDVQVPITIKIVDSKEVNALSFPGGFIYINSGLILEADDESEIASVIAHEIGHVVARDGMKSGRYLGMGPDVSPVIIPSPEPTNALTDLGGYLVPLKFVGSPRETDADEKAIGYMKKAGYNPSALVVFLQKMQAKELTDSQNVLEMFQTHPSTTERVRLAQERVASLPADMEFSVQSGEELANAKAALTQYHISHPDALGVDPQ